MTTVARRTWGYAVTYMGLSMGIEIVLIAAVGLRVPRDNHIIAPILLTIAPVAAAWIAGYRRPKVFALLVVLTVVLTILCVLIFSRLTGISTGILEPIVVRTLAGFLAATITARLAPNAEPTTKARLRG